MKLLLICPEYDRSLGLFADFDSNPSVLVKYVGLRKKWYRRILKAIYTARYMTGFSLPLPKFLFDSSLPDLTSDRPDKIIIRSNVLEFVPVRLFQSLRRQGYRCEILLLDAFCADTHTIKVTRKYLVRSLWDDIVTFDPDDARNFGFSFRGFHYYSKHDIAPGQMSADLYLIRNMKGNRGERVRDVYTYLTGKGVRCEFDILISDAADRNFLESGMHAFKKSISYDEVLMKTQNSGCILEILREGQSGPSLRYFEAVVYGKKLLTDNPHIKDFPYYDSRFMKVFTEPSDIDVEWLKSDLDVDYHYDGGFSPLKMLEQ